MEVENASLGCQIQQDGISMSHRSIVGLQLAYLGVVLETAWTMMLQCFLTHLSTYSWCDRRCISLTAL